MVDIQSFCGFLGIKKAELARRLGLPYKSNTLSMYDKGKLTPTYEMCVKLLEMGMSIDELFGAEIASNVTVFRNSTKSVAPAKLDLNDPAVKEAMQQALSDVLLKASQSLADKP